MIFWCVLITIGFIVQGAYIRSLAEEMESIKSWYPFCEMSHEIMKMQTLKDKGGENE